jgi:DNA replication protein DnaC
MDQIKSQLCSLRLSGMASCWQTLEETRRTPELSLKDGMELLLQAESDQRNVNRYARLLKSAGFRYNASIEELRAESARGMDRALIDRLAMGDYIRNGEAILITGSIIKLFDKLAKTDLLILDDFGLTPLQGQQQMDFMEIIEDRHAKKATIIASQLPVAKWFDVIGEETIADAILDRVVHTSYRFTLSGDTLRKKQ